MSEQTSRNHLISIFGFPALLVLIIWAVECVEYFGGFRFTRFGIFPRQIDGLKGILFSPFIHSGWSHLISNSLSLFALSVLMVFFYKKLIPYVYVGVILLTGICVWLFARESYHIGISGLIYGLIGFIFWSGVFRENIRSIILALVILVAYSGYFTGIAPEEGVSWESHLFGAISGAFFSFLLKNVFIEGDKEDTPKDPEELDGIYFFDKEVFTYTKQERFLRELEEE